jgi:hypothetical protein
LLGEAGISSKYDVDDILLLLETIRVFLFVFIIFILFFLRSVCRCRLEGFAQDHALPHRVVALRVDWTSLVVKNLVELVLRLVALLTTRGAIHSADSVVRLAFTRRIPLVVGPSTVVVTLPIVVVVTAWEATAFLLFFVRPALHHVS